MSIVNIQTGQVGLVGVLPSIAYIETTDPLATVMTAGYLNDAVQNGATFSLPSLAYVSTKETPTSAFRVGIFQIAHVGANWSIVNASSPAPGVVTLPTIANHMAIFTDTGGALGEDVATAINGGNIQAGLSGTAGTLISFPATAGNGSLILSALNAGGAFNTTIRNSVMGQSSVISLPDPGTATSKFVLQDGVNTVASIANLKYGATPVAQVDPASCTISAVAGAANVATITVQLKDGSGTNMTRIIPFRVYSSSAADGLTLQGAASTGYSVASGGLSLQNGAAITTQINCMSSATGGCVLSLTDTGKQTSYLVLVLPNGVKISTQLSAGSYG